MYLISKKECFEKTHSLNSNHFFNKERKLKNNFHINFPLNFTSPMKSLLNYEKNNCNTRFHFKVNARCSPLNFLIIFHKNFLNISSIFSIFLNQFSINTFRNTHAPKHIFPHTHIIYYACLFMSIHVCQTKLPPACIVHSKGLKTIITVATFTCRNAWERLCVCMCFKKHVNLRDVISLTSMLQHATCLHASSPIY